MLRVKKLSKSYATKTIFNEVNFEANLGQLILLTGPSGSGKSTFLDLLAGVKRWDNGEYQFQDIILSPNNDSSMSQFRNQYIGYVLQDFGLIDDYSVLENLLLPCHYSKTISKEKAETVARQYLTRFNLTHLSNKPTKQLSGGQKQRVAFIRSLVLSPRIILADEPTTNLDKDNYELVITLLKELANKDKIIVVSSHDTRLLDKADKVYTINNGQLLEQ